MVFFMKLKLLAAFVLMLESLPFLGGPFLKLMLDGMPFLSPGVKPNPINFQYLLLSSGNCLHLSAASIPLYPWAFLKANLPLTLLCVLILRGDLEAALSVVSFFFHSNLIIVEI